MFREEAPAVSERPGQSAHEFPADYPQSYISGAGQPNFAETAFPELDCIRPHLPAAIISAAERRSREIGMSADRVLITSNAISENNYVAALASSLGVDFEMLEEMPREACPLDDARLVEALAIGILPFYIDKALTFVIAPRGVAARRLFELIGQSNELRKRVRLTSMDRMQRFVTLRAGEAIGQKAAYDLRHSQPYYSAASIKLRSVIAVLCLLSLAAGTMTGPAWFSATIAVGLAIIFLAWTGLRVFAALCAEDAQQAAVRLSPDRLPIYTIIVALYREARAVQKLMTALSRFDYPPEKLDIKLVLEANDLETQAALAAVRAPIPFEIIIAPDTGPRTKPKALNAALQTARGSFVAIYDAEDEPEPTQLRKAIDAFRLGGPDVACVQARLTIDNTKDSWIAGIFTAEYAGLFDVFLPGIAACHLPLPLGGSSNHFRTDVLRKMRGWDPYNVTEDADLGMRLARCGYLTGVIKSTTYEEAPAKIIPWLKQRTRWFKGWMQTWLVHMGSPRTLLNDLGLAGFWTFQLVVGGTVLTALVHPFFAGAFLFALVRGELISDGDGIASTFLSGLYIGVFFAGYFTSIALGLIGLARRRLMAHGRSLIWVPVYWILLSLAAWRALFQLVSSPFHWEKTEHGLAKTSRLALQEVFPGSPIGNSNF